MLNLLERYAPLRENEGGGSGGDGDGSGGAGGKEGVQYEKKDGAGEDGDGGLDLSSVPEKFIREGKLDTNSLLASYSDLEKRLGQNKPAIEAAKEELLAGRPENPEAYNLPDFGENVNAEELAGHPVVEWFRGQAHEMGLPQDKFEEAVNTYVKSMAPDYEAEFKKLGNNAEKRVGAVDTWIKTHSEDEQQALHQIGMTAVGVGLLEKFMGVGGELTGDGDDDTKGGDQLTETELKSMQQDPRYWDASRRDPDFVKKIQDGWTKLYPPKQ